jgi:hypothetical protein
MGEDAETITIEEQDGDSPWVDTVPGFLRGMARGWDNRGERHRNLRMVRAVRRLYPVLCAVERMHFGPDTENGGSIRLDGVPFDRAVNDDRAIERGLSVFDMAWQAGAVTFRAANGKLVPPGKGKVIIPACGYSVDHVRHYFLDRAARIILRHNPKIYESLAPILTERAMLSRLRRIATLSPRVIVELLKGFNGHARRALFDIDPEILSAFSRMTTESVIAMRESLGAQFPEFVDRGAPIVAAVADTLRVPEQLRDLGQGLCFLRDPDAVRAIGGWDIRDVTEKVNEDREKRGLPVLVGPIHSTDIRVLAGVLGSEFNHLMEFPAPLLEAFGDSIRELRDLDVAPRQARVEQMSMFCQRYMDYLTNAETLQALFLSADADKAKVKESMRPNVPEVFFIMEGLWTKKGYGRKFFETVLSTGEGAKAMRQMMLDLVGLKERGSVKTPDDLVQIVSNSDLLDSPIQKFMARK